MKRAILAFVKMNSPAWSGQNNSGIILLQIIVTNATNERQP